MTTLKIFVTSLAIAWVAMTQTFSHYPDDHPVEGCQPGEEPETCEEPPQGYYDDAD